MLPSVPTNDTGRRRGRPLTSEAASTYCTNTDCGTTPATPRQQVNLFNTATSWLQLWDHGVKCSSLMFVPASIHACAGPDGFTSCGAAGNVRLHEQTLLICGRFLPCPSCRHRIIYSLRRATVSYADANRPAPSYWKNLGFPAMAEARRGRVPPTDSGGDHKRHFVASWPRGSEKQSQRVACRERMQQDELDGY